MTAIRFWLDDPTPQPCAMVAYPLPMRGQTANLVLPYDLSKQEVERICAFVRTLEAPWVLDGKG